MGRPVLKIKGYSPEEIKALIKKDERYTIGLRLYAVYQVALGQPSRKLEELGAVPNQLQTDNQLGAPL
jgi:hypothetical protein